MTFVANIPVAGQSPGLFPSQCSTNFTRLKTIINGDHVFNDSAQADDGVHRQVTMVARADPVSLPTNTNGIIYNKIVGATALPFYYDGTSVYAVPPCRAYVTFNSNGVAQGNFFGCTVAPLGGFPGTYTITFTPALPTIYPQFSLSCIEPSSNEAIGKVINFVQVGSTMTSMNVRFLNQNNTIITNIVQGNLIVFGG